MTRFAVRRLGQLILSLWVALTVIFVAVTQLPGDPVRALFGFKPPPPEIYRAIRDQFRLDDPLLQQYGGYLWDVLRGDLGNGYPLDPYGTATVGERVIDIVAAAAPVSAALLLAALVVQAVVGIATGSLSAYRSVGDGAGRWTYALALLLVSTPVLVAAFVLRTVFGSALGWLPVRGVVDGPVSYLLPVLALSALSTGYVILLTRSEVREALGAPYLTAARARGIAPAALLRRHALRPSLIPIIAFVAGNVGQLFVGLVIVEGIFGIPGLGGALFEAIANRDRTELVGLVTVVMVVVLVANALADVLTALVDPRVREAVLAT